MQIKDGRGQSRVALKNEIRKKIVNWFSLNPNSTKNECCASLGISRTTLRNHLKEMGI
jgi:predicted transcriptional regulator